jgi:hypothetical protein
MVHSRDRHFPGAASLAGRWRNRLGFCLAVAAVPEAEAGGGASGDLCIICPAWMPQVTSRSGPDFQQENDMCGAKRSGYLFMVAGCMFFLAAYFGKQVAFYALAAIFIALGASRLARARRR